MPRGNGLTFDVDSLRFDRAMTAFSTKFGIASADIVKTETRLLLQQIIKFTPPKTRAQGRQAVARDIGRAMNPLDASTFTSKKIAAFIRKKDVNSMREIVRRVPRWKNYTVEEFDPRRLHEEKRDSRGRIQRSKNVFVLDKKGWKKYVRRKQQNVGSGKAGWWPGLQAVGGAVPSYIARQASRFGVVDMSKANNKHSPHIRVMNFSTSAISQNDQNHTVQSAVRMRARSMESHIKRMASEIAKSSGL